MHKVLCTKIACETAVLAKQAAAREGKTLSAWLRGLIVAALAEAGYDGQN